VNKCVCVCVCICMCGRIKAVHSVFVFDIGLMCYIISSFHCVVCGWTCFMVKNFVETKGTIAMFQYQRAIRRDTYHHHHHQCVIDVILLLPHSPLYYYIGLFEVTNQKLMFVTRFALVRLIMWMWLLPSQYWLSDRVVLQNLLVTALPSSFNMSCNMPPPCVT
jgi:hypothetical protein